MKILYLVFDSINSPIVKSQVYDMSRRIVETEEIEFNIVTLENKIDKNALLKHNKIVIYPTKKSIFIISYLRFLFKILKVFSGRVDIVHVRSYFPMPIALILKKIFGVKVIFDMRGLLPEEHIYLNNKTERSINYKILKFMERIFVEASDEVIVVSNNFKDYIQNRYDYKGNIKTIYCSANNEKNKNMNITEDDFRRKYNINKSQIIITYVGSFYKYQKVQEIIKFISSALKIYDIKFLIFTKDAKEEVISTFAKYEVPSKNVEIDYLPNNVLTEYLRYCDYGVIFRDSNIINKVSSPIKISEYIINDMRVIFQGYIGDFNILLKEYECGIGVIRHNDDYSISGLGKKGINYKNPESLKQIVSYEFNAAVYSELYKKVLPNKRRFYRNFK